MFRKSKMCCNSWEASQWHPFHRIFVHPPDPHLSHPWANRISAFHGLHFDDVVIHQTLHLIHCRTRHDVGLGILWRRDFSIFPLGFVEGYGSWFYSCFSNKRPQPCWDTKKKRHTSLTMKEHTMHHNMILIPYKHISLDNSKFTSKTLKTWDLPGLTVAFQGFNSKFTGCHCS